MMMGGLWFQEGLRDGGGVNASQPGCCCYCQEHAHLIVQAPSSIAKTIVFHCDASIVSYLLSLARHSLLSLVI